jgi:light-regulated signal transduction histidine kinase (bacteriophytochrome)
LAGDIVYGLHTLRLHAQQQQAEAAVRQLNEELEQRVIKRTLELEASNRELEAFSYSISHDLRSPLRSLDGYSQILLEDYAGQLPPDGQAYLHRIRAAVQRMSEQIDALLGLSGLWRSELQRRPIDLSPLAHDIAHALRQQNADRQAKFIIADSLTANADPYLMRAVVENLLGNAWKFTAQKPDAQIEFGALLPPEGITTYFVRDNGAGFDMAYADKLFKPFQRLHSASEFPGHGIGLAIVERVIHRHGGQVWANSQVNGGATFYFTLGA